MASVPAAAARVRVTAWLRGEPLHVPTHALVIHFPAALLPTSLLFDVAGRAAPGLGLGPAAAATLILGLLGALAAAGTGLLDWLPMLPGKRRSRVTRHLLVQVSAVVLFGLSLVLRLAWPDLSAGLAPLVASGAGVVVLFVGDHLGGLLVYRDGMRVGSGRG